MEFFYFRFGLCNIDTEHRPNIKCPGHCKYDMGRFPIEIPIRVPLVAAESQEAINNEVIANPNVSRPFSSFVTSRRESVTHRKLWFVNHRI
ncbi:hypothetical protein TNIN_302181 [Trichonephila inaurata madagascariensis]|uniref:Uncharacterized protein n=1 Tax=Trichonephila inaurata madagascariensis TaxID=2747483 RepID=A0A8X6YA35_9ARAC|nr:hypothetical protein TNIN_302181 [Trichonephila inaurata madagascariensis]